MNMGEDEAKALILLLNQYVELKTELRFNSTYMDSVFKDLLKAKLEDDEKIMEQLIKTAINKNE